MTDLSFDVELPEFDVVVDPVETSVTVPETTVAVIAVEGDVGPQGPAGPAGADSTAEGPAGPPGPAGPGSPFLILTQTEYDALPAKDPNTLYCIV